MYFSRRFGCKFSACGGGGGGGCYSPEIWVGECGPPLETRTLFQTKICDFPYPISDLTQNSIPYFRPVRTLFRFVKPFRTSFNCPIIKSHLSGEEVASSKNGTQFQIKVHITYPISDRNGQNLYPILYQNGSKTIPFGAAHFYMASIRKYPPPPTVVTVHCTRLADK